MYTAANATTLALLGVLLILLAIIAVRAWRRSRITPDEKERRRRCLLAVQGKMNDASLLDVQPGLLTYSYAVGGAEYTASQDVSRLQQFLPADFAFLGHILVKYDPRNPANSIVLAEDWSGLQSVSTAPPASPLSRRP